MSSPQSLKARPDDHDHDHDHDDGHGHSHGLVDPSIKRSKDGLRVVLVSLALLGVTAAIQAAIYVATGSVALLADLIHNAGDALTAVPLGAAFVLRSERAERGAGVVVVLTILASAVVPGSSPSSASSTRSRRRICSPWLWLESWAWRATPWLLGCVCRAGAGLTVRP